MNLIASISLNGGIGYKNKLLFNAKEDMEFFKEKTLGKYVVMGRNTYESIGKPLKDRISIVFSRHYIKQKNVITVRNFHEFADYIKNINTDDIFVIGGEQLYKTLLPFCKTLYITKFNKRAEADRYLQINYNNYIEKYISRTYYDSNVESEFRFYTYENKDVCIQKNCSINLIATCNKCKKDKPYGLIPLPEIKQDTLYMNKKNKENYIILDISNNQTNCRNEEVMVIYQNIKGGKIYPRNIYEFNEKFIKAEEAK